MSCPNCAEGSVLPGEPIGTIESEYHGAYYAPKPVPSEGEGEHNRAILFLTDGFGLPLVNCKLMADNLAKRLNCDVWIPNYFDGRPLIGLDKLTLPDRAGVKMSLVDWIKFIFLTALPSLPAFIHSRPSVADKRVITLIELLKSKRGYSKFGVVGYCFGGAAAARFAGTDYIHSAVICHPGSFSIGEVKAIRVPTAWACAEEDIFFPPSLRLQSEAHLASRKEKDDFVDYEFVDYKGTAHGFAARPNLNLPEIKEAHDLAFEQTVKWFEKTLI